MGANEERAKGKIEELKGHVKHSVGDMIGNDQMKTEGRAEEAAGEARQEAAKAAERLKGTAEQAKGKVKDAVGGLMGDDEMQAEGKADQLRGKLRDKANQ